jgi:hypothetical protein
MPIVPEFVELSPNQYRWFGFSIAADGGQVGGSFAAQGGLGNDVLIYVIPASELQAFQSGYPFKVFYESGKVHAATFSRALPLGSYYLILKSPTEWTTRRVRCDIRMAMFVSTACG